MQLTQKHRDEITWLYCLVFYALMFLKLWNGFLLFQVKPFIFNTRFDLVTWLFMNTGIHQWLLNNPFGWLAFDVLFYILPIVYLSCYKKSVRLAGAVSISMFIFNFIYIQCYTLYPNNSIESFTAWILFPLLLMTTKLKAFYHILHALRYFFLFFFASAAVWKFVQGGIFNINQMSEILLYQHKEYLVSSPTNWYSRFIYWLVSHPGVSYCLYAAAALLELSFFTGFITRKYDKLLLALFILFLLMDIIIMRIPYWEVAPFLICLLYSKYSEPADNPNYLSTV
jgi:hypothetical protein